MKHIILTIILATSSLTTFAQTKNKKKVDSRPRQEAQQAEQRPAESRRARPTFERQYGLAGCGLGSVVMGKHGGQISAATTNGTSWNQTFAISAGTLNCIDPKTAEVASRMDQFIIVNKSQLQADIAKGNGETISAIGSYMGCSNSSEDIAQSLKSNYSTIFSNGKTNEITDSIINVILSNPELSAKCSKIIG